MRSKLERMMCKVKDLDVCKTTHVLNFDTIAKSVNDDEGGSQLGVLEIGCLERMNNPS